MNYEEYKGKLLDIKASLDELYGLQKEKYQSYRNFIDTISEINFNTKLAQIEVLNKQFINNKERYTSQSAFLEELIDMVKYQELTEDILKRVSNGITNKQSESKVSNNTLLSKNSFTQYPSNEKKEDINKATSSNVSTGVVESAFYEKYISRFLAAYKTASADCYLDVYKKYVDELSNYNLSTWNNFPDKNDISLADTQGNAKYYAFSLSKNDNKYFFAVPAKAVRFSEMQIVQGAFLTFFDLPLDDIAKSGGVMPNLVRPAVLEKKEDGLYYLKEKGKYQY